MAEYIIQESTLTGIGDAVRSKRGIDGKIPVPDLAGEILKISSGIELNFTVVGGTTAPADPSDNTIWVNTSTDITGYTFSKEQPAAASEGMVWIVTSNSSAVAFDALKENAITVYPKSCKQYIGGAWVSKTAKTYMNGGWVDWIRYLYNAGDECTDLTGGWVCDIGTIFNSGSLTKNSSGMTLVVEAVEGGANGGGESVVRTKNKIDLSNVEKISFVMKEVASSGYQTTTLYISDGSANVVEKDITVADTHDLDVSALSGEYYVGIYVLISQWQTATVTVTEVRF